MIQNSKEYQYKFRYRLLYYDRNNNFRNDSKVEIEPEENQLIKTPPKECYKDMNISSPVPSLSNQHIIEYMKRFDKRVGFAEDMYKGGYLRFLRFCIQGIFFNNFSIISRIQITITNMI